MLGPSRGENGLGRGRCPPNAALSVHTLLLCHLSFTTDRGLRRGQGAAQAIEDAEAIAQAFTRYRGQTDPIHALLAYQKKRSKRATEIQTRSSEMKTIHGLPDGPLQEERDWKLREKPPFGGFPNPWSDPVFQKRLWGLT